MKILIITMDVGRTAPGIVFEKLIDGLSKIHTVDLLTSDFDPSFELRDVNRTFEIRRMRIHPRIHKFLIAIFGVNPLDLFWSKKAKSRISKRTYESYDLIFSFLSLHHYAPLLAGILLKKKYLSKLAVHTLDAIPAPVGWPENQPYFRSVKRMMAKYLTDSDFFFSTNEQMLKYQLSTFVPKKNLISEVILNPCYGNLEYYDYEVDSKNTFLYTGGLYGLRKPEYILAAFKKILKVYPNSTFEFVGSNFSEDCLSIFSFDEQKKIIIHPFARDLTEYYKRAVALIDIDADLPNDVFLSSKIINYLTINRIIISETGSNSPSRKIFNGIPSILQCDHAVDELANAMVKAIEMKGKVDFDDREKVVSLFKINSVIKKLNDKITFKL
jgi:glycosyltransferase involved in cell wall biosynthesis